MAQFKSLTSVKGRLRLVLTGPDGQVKLDREEENLVVDTGLNYIANRMKEAVVGAMSHVAVGSGATAAAAGDTALDTQISTRKALTSTTVTAGNIVYATTFAAGESTGAITEAGIFNAASAGVMLCRTVFAVVNKGADDTLAITWTVSNQAGS